MTTFATLADSKAIEAQMPWEKRDVPPTLHALLSRTAGRFPQHKAVSYQLTSGPADTAETLTWSELLGRVTQAANLFRSLGVGEKDVVAYVLPNASETVLTLLGGAIAGIVNPINPLLDAGQIAAILRETKAKVVVTLKAFPKTDVPQKVAEAVLHAPDVRTVLEVDLLRYLTPPKSWIVPLIRPKNPVRHHARVLDFAKEMAKQPRTLAFADSAGDRVAAYFHTGGTTGMPKVAQHTYGGMIYNGWVGDTLLFTEQDNIICPLPLFHVFACHVILMAALSSGAHVVFPTPQGYRGEGVFDNFWKLIERWKISFIITVPTAISALMQRPVNADISTVKTAFSGSAPLPVELYRRFEKATGVNIIEGYGLTEATCLVSCNPIDGPKKIGSVGIPFPYTDVKILVHTARDGVAEQGVDEVGEICVANPGVLPGATYTESDKNLNLFHYDVYLRTGDLGRIDAEGPRRDRRGAGGPRGGGDGRCHRPARRACGRTALRLCGTREGRLGHDRGTDGLRSRPYPRTRGAPEAPRDPRGAAEDGGGQGLQARPAPPRYHPRLQRRSTSKSSTCSRTRGAASSLGSRRRARWTRRRSRPYSGTSPAPGNGRTEAAV